MTWEEVTRILGPGSFSHFWGNGGVRRKAWEWDYGGESVLVRFEDYCVIDAVITDWRL
ncbi:MAG: hypothetical protein JXA57_15125 [Armatimonadetes bacterium]|nr:hypothetical protein [Armatimonadota bacterium]